MPSAVRLKRELFSILSWRTEARATTLPPDRAQRMRDRVGQFMRWARAHDSLPALEQRAVVLCFHGVIAHDPDPEVECEHLPLAGFRQLLDLLRRSFRVISLCELVDAIRTGQSPPARSVVITFDDGYANNAEVAAEELARRRLPWSAFLPAQLVESRAYQWIDDVRLLIHRGDQKRVILSDESGRHTLELSTSALRRSAVQRVHEVCRYVPDEIRRERLAGLYGAYSDDQMASLRDRYRSFAPMSWDQARQLKSDGVEVASHSLTHTALGPQTPAAIRREVFGARDLLVSRLGSDSTNFSYPFGRLASLSRETEAVLREAGYNSALTLEQDCVRCREVNLLQCPRLIVSPAVGRMVFSLWQRFLR
jgi:peptidoglycan/xylan/chitin deacetylase (PgdA/CDA1 family)